jgi:nucleoside-diphosphate-sugar epimerase
MFEAAKASGINHLVFASTAGVYGKKNTYEERLMDHDSRLDPVNHYGVFKQANEGTARIYWQDDSIGSIGLRPYTVYGPGRDQGITSTPTQAMLAAVRGEPYHISFGGYTGFHYVSDVAKLFIQVSQIAFKGSEVFNIGGAVAHMSEAVEAIKAVIPEAVVTHEETPLPFPDGQTDEELRALLGDVPDTSLADGIRETIVHFQSAVGDGRLSASS